MSAITRPIARIRDYDDLAPIDRLQSVINRIALLSHAPASAYDSRQPHDTSEDIGGRRPSGSEIERAPRRPAMLRRGNERSEAEWRDWEDEMAAWRACYHRKTPAYFEAKLARCFTERALTELLHEAERTLNAWIKTPENNADQLERDSFFWKCAIADELGPGKLTKAERETLCKKYDVSNATLYRYRLQYRGLCKSKLARAA